MDQVIGAGAILRAHRKDLGLSVFKVGRRVGVSGNHISRVERGLTDMSSQVLTALAELYTVSPEYILGLYSTQK